MALEDQSRLYQALDEIQKYQWAVFTSPTGAEIFFEEMKKHHTDIRRLFGLKLAAIGQGTRKVLEDRGLLVDLMPEDMTGIPLGEVLAAQLQGGEHILLPRAQKGNENLVKLMEKAGGIVDDIPTYETVYESSRIIDIQKEIEKNQIDCVVFTSASTVKGFVESVGSTDYAGLTAAASGKQTKRQQMLLAWKLIWLKRPPLRN